jgi:xanthine dehydrogenase molybdopterin-binding subunit B
VLVYTDGTALVTHAAVEMGQGINIKMIQVRVVGVGTPPLHSAR